MKLATWNVNSIKARHQLVTSFLQEYQIDVLAMQEIKTLDENFPFELFQPYQVATLGGKTYNGVAISSRFPLLENEKHFPGQPSYSNRGVDTLEPRCLRSRIQVGRKELDVYSLYVPNGRELSHPHYQYKLVWLERLAEVISQRLQAEPDRLMALVGDWNIAYQDRDVWSQEYWEGKTHVSALEREAFARFRDIGLVEVTRQYFDEYTYWNYQKGRFQNDEGMRIDYAYCSPALAKRVYGAISLREKRHPQPLAAPGNTDLFSAQSSAALSDGNDLFATQATSAELLVPSDHVPIVLDIELG